MQTLISPRLSIKNLECIPIRILKVANLFGYYNIPPYTILELAMSHLKRDKSKLVSRLRRIKGQVEGVERALDAETDCGEILRQIASIRGAITGLTNEVLEEHIRSHVINAPTASEREKSAVEVIQILKSYIK